MGLFGVFAAPAGAIYDELPLKSELQEKVSGQMIISDVGNIEDERHLELFLTGLEPNTVYTVWLSRPGAERESAGLEDQSFFKTDGSGNAHYIATLSEYDLNRFDKVEIAEHPDGDPQNLENSILTLSADIEHRRK